MKKWRAQIPILLLGFFCACAPSPANPHLKEIDGASLVAGRDDLSNLTLTSWQLVERTPNSAKLHIVGGDPECVSFQVRVVELSAEVRIFSFTGTLPNAPQDCSMVGQVETVTVNFESSIENKRLIDALTNEEKTVSPSAGSTEYESVMILKATSLVAIVAASATFFYSFSAAADPTQPRNDNKGRVAKVELVPLNSKVLKAVKGTVTNETDPAYWTDQRLREAIPVDMGQAEPPSATKKSTSSRVAGISDAEFDGTPSRVEPVAPSSRFPSLVTNWSHINGKVFFLNTVDNKKYVCSGTAVATKHKTTVMTAGHCVHGGERQKVPRKLDLHSRIPQWRSTPWHVRGDFHDNVF